MIDKYKIKILAISFFVLALLSAHGFKSQQDYLEAKEKLNLFTLVYENAPDPHWIKKVDLESGPGKKDITLLYLNPAYTDMFGFTLEEYYGKRDVDVWGEAEGEGFYESDLQTLEKGGNCVLKTIGGDGKEFSTRTCKWIIQSGDLVLLAGRSSVYKVEDMKPVK